MRKFVATSVRLVFLVLVAFVAITVASDHFQAQAVLPHAKSGSAAVPHKKARLHKKHSASKKPVVALSSLSREDRERFYPSAKAMNDTEFSFDVVYRDKSAPRSWRSELARAQRAWNKPLNCPAGVKLRVFVPGSSSLDLYAVAAKANCIIWISTINFRQGYRPTRRERCIILAHELGHIYGRKHRVGTLMNETLLPSIRVPACGDAHFKSDSKRANPQAFVN